MQLSLLVAFDENRLIGDGNAIPWHLPEDMKRVRLLTTGNTIVMGENTYNSIGHPLKGRKNVILSNNPDFVVEGAIVVHSKEEALEVCKNDKEVFIFGGASIYKLFLEDVTRMYITYIHEKFTHSHEAVFFPEINLTNWQLKYCKLARYNVKYKYSYNILERVDVK